MAKLTLGDDQLELDLRGHPNFRDALDAAKAVPGRRFDGDRKLWVFPPDPHVAERLLVTVKPEVSPEVLSWVKTIKAERQKELVTPLPKDAEVLVPWGSQRAAWHPAKIGRPGEEVDFNGLFEHQRAFVDHVASGNTSVLLADDMGLGKTAQAASATVEFLLRKSDVSSKEISLGGTYFKSADDVIGFAGVGDLDKPKLVVAPNSVKGTWARELLFWLGDNTPVQIIDAKTFPKRAEQIESVVADKGWAIINWEQLQVTTKVVKKRKKLVNALDGSFLGWKEVEEEEIQPKQPLFRDTDWLAVIADEAHRAKNRDAKTTKGLWLVDGTLKFALTGTPLMNSPDELWAILRWLYPEQYGKTTKTQRKVSYWVFYNEYVDFYEGQFGKIITGVKNPDALRFELKNRLVRRTKNEVLDLPPKMRKYVPVTLPPKQRKLYAEAEKQLWLEIEQAVREGDKDAIKLAKTAVANPAKVYQIVNGAARFVRLRQIISSPALLGGPDESAKLDAAQEIILDAQPKQMVVFSEFVETCHLLVGRLRKAGLTAEAFTGERSTQERTELENQFQAGEIDVLVGTISAMREGVTLTAADTQVWIERSVVPARNEQGEDRCHRIGQEDAVTIIILEAEDTVDTQKVSPINTLKSFIVASVLAKDEVKEVSA